MPTKPPQHRPTYHRTRKQFDKQRNPQKNKTYDHAWRKLRDAHIQANPICKHCIAEGILTPATEVDHIVPVKIAPERRLDPTNLQSLCKPCHSRKTAFETLNTRP